MDYEATDIAALLEEEAKRQGINPELAKKVVLHGENFGNKKITDVKNPESSAQGIGQHIDSTWRSLITKKMLREGADRSNVTDSVAGVVAVLKDNLSRTGGNEMAAVAGYHGGPDAEKAVLAGKPPPRADTISYLKRTGYEPVYGDGVVADSTSSTTLTGGQKRDTVISGASADLRALLEKNAKFMEQLRSAVTGQVDNAKIGADAVIGKGAAHASSIETQGAIDVATQQKAQDIVTLFHSGVKDPDNVIAASLRKTAEADETMAQLKPVIDAEDQVMPWDNPLRWLANQFTQPGLKMAYNAAHASKAKAVQDVMDAKRMFEAQAAMDPAITVDLVKQKAATTAAATRFEALQQSAKLLEGSNSALAQLAAQEITVAGHDYARGMEIRRLTLDSAGIMRAEHADKKVAEALDRINFKRQQLALPPYTVSAFELLPAKAKEALIENSMFDSIGANAGDSMRVLVDTGATGTIGEKMPAVNEFYTKLIKSDDFKDVLAKVKANPKFVNLEETEQRIIAMTELSQQHNIDLDEKQNKNSLLRDSNPYKLKLANAVLIPELANNPFTQVAKDALATSPDKLTVKDKDLFSGAVAMAEANPKKLREISQQLSEFYTTGIDMQWMRAGARAVGYARPRGYGVSGESAGFATDRAIQMASPAEVEHALIAALSQRRARSAAGSDKWWTDDTMPPNQSIMYPAGD